MRKIIAPLIIGAALSTAFAADDSLKQEIEALKTQMAELKSAQSKMNIDALRAQVTEIKAHDAGDNIKWNVDFRTSYDVIDYKITDGSKTDNAIWTNKLILGMAAQPADNLVFKGALGVYKTFGQNNINDTSMFQGFDWYGTQKPGDDSIKLREAYFLYFGDMGDVHYSASFGRRPSVDGFMTNLRADNENPASPVGHNINMEFDGASFKFDLDKVTGISGMYIKLCLGRGFSETTGAYSQGTAGFNPAYIKDGMNPNMDLAGLLMQFYDDGQYKIMANVFKGWNMMGVGMELADQSLTRFYDVGDMTGASLSLQVNGIGNGINDFLDDSVFFISYAVNKTDPNNVPVNTYSGSMVTAINYGMSGAGMLGSTEKETGSSIYTGVQVPGIMAGQRLGLEYNHGSKYWRSFTYGEDTLAGSKLATRGDAYEIYYILPIVKKNLTAQLSYVYMDYNYAGSDMFFGQTGNPEGLMGMMPYVESASNIKASIRYRY
ncbi:MAG: DUF3373 family protein [Campylobacteraceae bacterium]|nr:DUF3373 family protein [Campylobacteraceae bacterium]